MKIHTSEYGEKVSNLKKEKKFIPLVIDRVLTICKEDKHFSKNNDFKLEHDLKTLTIKNKKQDKLVEQSRKIEKDLKEKMTQLENESFSLKVSILEALGSEI